MFHQSAAMLKSAAPSLSLSSDAERVEAWVAGARECGLVVFPFGGPGRGRGVWQLGQEDDGPNDYGAASYRFMKHPAFNAADGLPKGLVFDMLCAELGIDPDDVDLCAKVNAHLAQQDADRPPAMHAAE